MTRQEAEQLLEGLEKKIKDDVEKGWAANSNCIIASVALQTAIRNGVFDQQQELIDQTELIKRELEKNAPTKPKKRGRPKGSKNRKKA